MVGLYFVASSLWIAFSDKLLAVLVTDPNTNTHIAIIKGWFFVLVTSLLLYQLLAKVVSVINSNKNELLRINEAYRVTSEVSRCVSKSTGSEQEMLDAVCNAIANGSGYHLAWIGFKYYDEEKSIKIVSRAGLKPEYLEDIRISWGDNEYAEGLVGQAVKTGKIIVCQNVVSDSLFNRWKINAANDGFAASIAIPLRYENEIFGALKVYSTEHSAFNEDEKNLLAALAEDLSFGIHSRRLKKQAKASEQIYKTIVNTVPDGLVLTDAEGVVSFANASAERLFSLTNETITGRDYKATDWNITDRDGNPIAMNELPFALVKKTGKPVYSFQHAIQRPDGIRILLQINAGPLFDDDGNFSGMVASVSDITEREKIEFALRKSERFAKEILEKVSDAFIALDADWCCTFINQKAAEFFGKRSGELEGNDIWEVFPEGVGTSLYTAYQTALSEHRFIELEEFYATTDRWFENRIFPSENGLSIFIRDVTQRKRAEKMYELSQNIISTAFNNSPDAISITKLRDGHFIYLNESFTRIFGYSKDEVMRHTPADLGIWVSEADATRYYEDLHKEGRVTNYLMDFKMKSGKICNTEISAEIIENSGEVTIFAIIRDVTERKRTEAALLESEQRFHSLYENAADAFFLYNTEGHILEVNNQTCENLGYSKYELLTMNVADIDVENALEGVKELWTNIPLDHPVTMRSRLKRKDGTMFPVESRIVSIQIATERLFLGLVRDISENERTEREILDSREQLHKLALHLQNIREEERAAIARELHDDLGQLLTSIKMNLSLLRREISPSQPEISLHHLDEELKSMTGLIDRSVKGLRKLITELRPEVLENLGLVTAIEWQGNEFKNKSGIDCKFETAVHDLVFKKEAEVALFRVFQESLTNVARHSQATCVVVKTFVTEGRFVMEVVDNGIGISDEGLRKNNSFGLLGMKERIGYFGGDFSIVGQAGKGTTVRVSIPIENF